MTSNWAFRPEMQCEQNWKLMFHSNKGIFFGEESIVKVLPFTLLRLTLFFIISHALHRLLRPLKQTEYVSRILAGIILGPSVFGKIKKYEGITNIPSQVQFINCMCYVGFLYYVFILAVKTDSGMILRFRRQFWVMGTTTMFTSFIFMSTILYTYRPIKFHLVVNTFVFPLQTSSTWFINLVPLLDELNLLTTEFGQLSLSLALTNEFWMWTSAIILIIYKTVNRGFNRSVLPLCVFLFMIVFIVRPIMLWIVRRLPRGQPVKDIYVVGLMLGAGVTACISDILIGSPLMGIIFIGLTVPHGPPLGLAIVERGETYVENCLLPFFFIAVGDSVIFDKHIRGQYVYQLIILGGHLVKFIITMLCGMWYKMSNKHGIALGLIMNTTGVVHLMVYWSQWIRQRTDRHISSQLIVSSVLVTAVATPLALYFHNQSTKINYSIRGFQLSVQSALMSSEMHILACLDTEDDIIGLLNFFKASNPSDSNPIWVHLVHFVELVGQAAPTLIPHKKHNRICKYNGCIQIMNAVRSYCDTLEGLTIQLLTMIAPFTTINSAVCKLAEDKMIPLVIVPFVYKSHSYHGHSVSSQINYKLQQHAPCTLGIFVNRDTNTKNKSFNNKNYNNNNNTNTNQSVFSYHVVIFFGGEDDREALSYATRMCTHSGVSVTLLRIFVDEYESICEEDVSLDNSAVDEFKDKISDTSSVIYREFHVEEGLQIIKVVQSLEKRYDLVILGKRHGREGSKLGQEACVLNENPELGEIGELLVLGDLNWENTSFLIMQHCLDSDRDNNIVLLDDGDS